MAGTIPMKSRMESALTVASQLLMALPPKAVIIRQLIAKLAAMLLVINLANSSSYHPETKPCTKSSKSSPPMGT